MADPTILQGHGAVRVTIKAGVAAFVPGTPLGYNAGWVLADADALIKAELIAAEYGKAGDTITAYKSCTVYDSDAPYTAGGAIYLSTTAGSLTQTKPAISATLTYLQRVGVALSTDTVNLDAGMDQTPQMWATASLDPANLGAQTSAENAVTVTGILATDMIVGISIPSALNAGLVLGGARISGADTVQLRIANLTGGAINDGANTWGFMFQR